MRKKIYSCIVLLLAFIFLSCAGTGRKITNKKLTAHNVLFETGQATDFQSGKSLTYRYCCPVAEKEKKKTYPLIVITGKFSDGYLFDELIERIDAKKENVSYILTENAEPNALVAVVNDFRSVNYPVTDDMIYLIADTAKFIRKIKLEYEVLFANIIVPGTSKIEKSLDKLLGGKKRNYL